MTLGKAKRSTVLGGGAWGTALAKVLAERGEDVSLWCQFGEEAAAINLAHENEKYLSGIELPPNLVATADLDEALGGSDFVAFVVPSHATREVARKVAPRLRPGTSIVSATKGIENDSLMFMDEVLRAELPPPLHSGLAFLSGPSFARELGRRLPTLVVVAAEDGDVRNRTMSRLRTSYFKLYSSEDVVGVECGGALKNVVAIAAGAIDGLGLGHNTRAALITRGLAEIARVALARGGSALTLAGLAGMGDLVLTCTGELSRNRTVGLELARGKSLDQIVAGLGHVAEGIKTAKSGYELSKKLGVDMPITCEVYRVLYEGKRVQTALDDLMARELGPEF